MNTEYENLKQKTLSTLTKLKDEVSKLQHKILASKNIVMGENFDKVAYEVTDKTMANTNALNSSKDYYKTIADDASESIKGERWLSKNYRNYNSIAKNSKKVIATIDQMVAVVKDFEEKSKTYKNQETEKQNEAVENENANVNDEDAPVVPVSDDDFVKVPENKHGKNKKKDSAKKTVVIENANAMEQAKNETPTFSTVDLNKEFSFTVPESSYGNISNYSNVLNDNYVFSTDSENKPVAETKETVNDKQAPSTPETKTTEVKNKEQKENQKPVTKTKTQNKKSSAKQPAKQTAQTVTNSNELSKDEIDEESKVSLEAIKQLEDDEIGAPSLTESIKDVPDDEKSNGNLYNAPDVDADELVNPEESNKTNAVSQESKDKKPVQVNQPTKKTDEKPMPIAKVDEKPMLPVVLNPEKPSVLNGIDEKYYKNIFSLINNTIVIGNKKQYNSLENLEYELQNADIVKLQELGFPAIDDPKKADLIKTVMLKFVKMSKDIRKDQWLSSLNPNKKDTFEARKRTNQEAIVDRNLKLIKYLNISPLLANKYGLSFSVEEVNESVKDAKQEARKGMKKVASENNRDQNFINFYNTFKRIHTLGSVKDENTLNYIYQDLTSENNSFELTGESLNVALNLVKQEIVARRNSKTYSNKLETKSSEKEEVASNDGLTK